MNAILEVLTKDNIAFFADKIIPILTLLGAVFAAIAAIYKYFNEKNREFYMSVLNDVYEPLYEETDEYVDGVIQDIKKKWTLYSRNRKFHAIFATSSIPEAVKYYRLMVKALH